MELPLQHAHNTYLKFAKPLNQCPEKIRFVLYMSAAG